MASCQALVLLVTKARNRRRDPDDLVDQNCQSSKDDHSEDRPEVAYDYLR